MNELSGKDWLLGAWIETPPVRVRDPETGVEYEVLTGGVGNNTHVYFNRANFTGDGRHLIFRSDRTGSWPLYAYDIAGRRLRRLTNAVLDPGRPSIDQQRPLRYQETPDPATGHEYWCADGRHVDYVRHCKGQPTAVCRVDTLSGQETVLTLHGYCHFISDRSGNRIVGDDADFVTLLDVPTGKLTPLVRHNQELTIANTLYHPHPAFSPDGKRIVFCRRDTAGRNDVCLLCPSPTGRHE